MKHISSKLKRWTALFLALVMVLQPGMTSFANQPAGENPVTVQAETQENLAENGQGTDETTDDTVGDSGDQTGEPEENAVADDSGEQEETESGEPGTGSGTGMAGSSGGGTSSGGGNSGGGGGGTGIPVYMFRPFDEGRFTVYLGEEAGEDNRIEHSTEYDYPEMCDDSYPQQFFTVYSNNTEDPFCVYLCNCQDGTETRLDLGDGSEVSDGVKAYGFGVSPDLYPEGFYVELNTNNIPADGMISAHYDREYNTQPRVGFIAWDEYQPIDDGETLSYDTERNTQDVIITPPGELGEVYAASVKFRQGGVDTEVLYRPGTDENFVREQNGTYTLSLFEPGEGEPAFTGGFYVQLYWTEEDYRFHTRGTGEGESRVDLARCEGGPECGMQMDEGQFREHYHAYNRDLYFVEQQDVTSLSFTFTCPFGRKIGHVDVYAPGTDSEPRRFETEAITYSGGKYHLTVPFEDGLPGYVCMDYSITEREQIGMISASPAVIRGTAHTDFDTTPVTLRLNASEEDGFSWNEDFEEDEDITDHFLFYGLNDRDDVHVNFAGISGDGQEFNVTVSGKTVWGVWMVSCFDTLGLVLKDGEVWDGVAFLNADDSFRWEIEALRIADVSGPGGTKDLELTVDANGNMTRQLTVTLDEGYRFASGDGQFYTNGIGVNQDGAFVSNVSVSEDAASAVLTVECNQCFYPGDNILDIHMWYVVEEDISGAGETENWQLIDGEVKIRCEEGIRWNIPPVEGALTGNNVFGEIGAEVPFSYELTLPSALGWSWDEDRLYAILYEEGWCQINGFDGEYRITGIDVDGLTLTVEGSLKGWYDKAYPVNISIRDAFLKQNGDEDPVQIGAEVLFAPQQNTKIVIGDPYKFQLNGFDTGKFEVTGTMGEGEPQVLESDVKYSYVSDSTLELFVEKTRSDASFYGVFVYPDNLESENYRLGSDQVQEQQDGRIKITLDTGRYPGFFAIQLVTEPKPFDGQVAASYTGLSPEDAQVFFLPEDSSDRIFLENGSAADYPAGAHTFAIRLPEDMPEEMSLWGVEANFETSGEESVFLRNAEGETGADHFFYDEESDEYIVSVFDAANAPAGGYWLNIYWSQDEYLFNHMENWEERDQYYLIYIWNEGDGGHTSLLSQRVEEHSRFNATAYKVAKDPSGEPTVLTFEVHGTDWTTLNDFWINGNNYNGNLQDGRLEYTPLAEDYKIDVNVNYRQKDEWRTFNIDDVLITGTAHTPLAENTILKLRLGEYSEYSWNSDFVMGQRLNGYLNLQTNNDRSEFDLYFAGIEEDGKVLKVRVSGTPVSGNGDWIYIQASSNILNGFSEDAIATSFDNPDACWCIENLNALTLEGSNIQSNGNGSLTPTQYTLRLKEGFRWKAGLTAEDLAERLCTDVESVYFTDATLDQDGTLHVTLRGTLFRDRDDTVRFFIWDCMEQEDGEGGYALIDGEVATENNEELRWQIEPIQAITITGEDIETDDPNLEIPFEYTLTIDESIGLIWNEEALEEESRNSTMHCFQLEDGWVFAEVRGYEFDSDDPRTLMIWGHIDHYGENGNQDIRAYFSCEGIFKYAPGTDRAGEYANAKLYTKTNNCPTIVIGNPHKVRIGGYNENDISIWMGTEKTEENLLHAGGEYSFSSGSSLTFTVRIENEETVLAGAQIWPNYNEGRYFELGSESFACVSAENREYRLVLDWDLVRNGFNLNLDLELRPAGNTFMPCYDNQLSKDDIVFLFQGEGTELEPIEAGALAGFDPTKPLTLVLKPRRADLYGFEVIYANEEDKEESFFLSGGDERITYNSATGTFVVTLFTEENPPAGPFWLQIYWARGEYDYEHLTDDKDMELYSLVTLRRENANGGVSLYGNTPGYTRYGETRYLITREEAEDLKFTIMSYPGISLTAFWVNEEQIDVSEFTYGTLSCGDWSDHSEITATAVFQMEEQELFTVNDICIEGEARENVTADLVLTLPEDSNYVWKDNITDAELTAGLFFEGMNEGDSYAAEFESYGENNNRKELHVSLTVNLLHGQYGELQLDVQDLIYLAPGTGTEILYRGYARNIRNENARWEIRSTRIMTLSRTDGKDIETVFRRGEDGQVHVNGLRLTLDDGYRFEEDLDETYDIGINLNNQSAEVIDIAEDRSWVEVKADGICNYSNYDRVEFYLWNRIEYNEGTEETPDWQLIPGEFLSRTNDKIRFELDDREGMTLSGDPVYAEVGVETQFTVTLTLDGELGWIWEEDCLNREFNNGRLKEFIWTNLEPDWYEYTGWDLDAEDETILTLTGTVTLQDSVNHPMAFYAKDIFLQDYGYGIAYIWASVRTYEQQELYWSGSWHDLNGSLWVDDARLYGNAGSAFNGRLSLTLEAYGDMYDPEDASDYVWDSENLPDDLSEIIHIDNLETFSSIAYSINNDGHTLDFSFTGYSSCELGGPVWVTVTGGIADENGNPVSGRLQSEYNCNALWDIRAFDIVTITSGGSITGTTTEAFGPLTYELTLDEGYIWKENIEEIVESEEGFGINNGYLTELNCEYVSCVGRTLTVRVSGIAERESGHYLRFYLADACLKEKEAAQGYDPVTHQIATKYSEDICWNIGVKTGFHIVSAEIKGVFGRDNEGEVVLSLDESLDDEWNLDITDSWNFGEELKNRITCNGDADFEILEADVNGDLLTISFEFRPKSYRSEKLYITVTDLLRDTKGQLASADDHEFYWTIRNGYSQFFIDGIRNREVLLSGEVRELSIDLVEPDKYDEYRFEWKVLGIPGVFELVTSGEDNTGNSATLTANGYAGSGHVLVAGYGRASAEGRWESIGYSNILILAANTIAVTGLDEDLEVLEKNHTAHAGLVYTPDPTATEKISSVVWSLGARDDGSTEDRLTVVPSEDGLSATIMGASADGTDPAKLIITVTYENVAGNTSEEIIVRNILVYEGELPTYSVGYDMNGGTGIVSSQSVRAGEAVKIRDFNGSRNGIGAEYWYEGDDVYYPGEYIVPTRDMRLTASYYKNGWIQEDGKWAYYFEGDKVCSEWLTSGNKEFRLGEDGYTLSRARVESDGKIYAVDGSGAKILNDWGVDASANAIRPMYLKGNGEAYGSFDTENAKIGNRYYTFEDGYAVADYEILLQGDENVPGGETDCVMYLLRNNVAGMSLPVLQSDGFVFRGWYDEYGNEVTDEDLAAIRANCTLEASWEVKQSAPVHVIYMEQGLDDVYREVDSEILDGIVGEMTNVTAPARTGFTAQTVTQQTITEDGVEIEVRYDRNSYTLSFDSGNHEEEIGTFQSRTFLYGESVELPAVTPYAPDLETFLGWYANGGKLNDGEPMPACNLTVTAQIAYSENFEYDGIGWKYRTSDGLYVKGEILGIPENEPFAWYYMDEDGYMTFNHIEMLDGHSHGRSYIFGNDGRRVYGEWVTVMADCGELDYITRPELKCYATGYDEGYRSGWAVSGQGVEIDGRKYCFAWDFGLLTGFVTRDPWTQNLYQKSQDVDGYYPATAYGNNPAGSGFTGFAEYTNIRRESWDYGNYSSVLMYFQNGERVAQGNYRVNGVDYTIEDGVLITGLTVNFAPGFETEEVMEDQLLVLSPAQRGASITGGFYAREGFAFTGWADEDGNIYEPGQTLSFAEIRQLMADVAETESGKLCLTAQWELAEDPGIPYTIEFWYQGTDGSYVRNDSQTRTEITDVPVGEVLFYPFPLDPVEGFYPPEVPEGQIVQETGTKFEVRYDRERFDLVLTKDNGISAVTGAKEGVYYDEEVTVSATAKTGYHFVNWTKDGKQVSESASYTFRMPAKANTDGATVDLEADEYALKANSAINTYTVKFNKNSEDATGSMEDQTFNYNESKALTSNAFVREGYEFGGWMTAATQTSATYTNGAVVSNLTEENGGEVTLYAFWTTKPIYTVEHYQQNLTGDGYTLTETETFQADTGTYVEPEVKTYEGFTAPAKQRKMVLGDGSLVIRYEYTRNSYSISLQAGTGIGGLTNAGTYLYGTTVMIDAQVLTGYSFKGWYKKNADGTFETDPVSTEKNASITVTENIFLRAVAEGNSYSVRFNAGEGEGSMEDQPFTYDAEGKALTANAFIRSGYAFIGWAATEGGAVVYADEAVVSNLTTEANGVVDLYARWMPLNGWFIGDDGATYYIVNGEKATGAQTIGEDIYYFGTDGKQVKGSWVNYNGEGDRYYIYEDGKAARNIRISYAGKFYGFGNDGKMLRGFATANFVSLGLEENAPLAATYFFSEQGIMAMGWMDVRAYVTDTNYAELAEVRMYFDPTIDNDGTMGQKYVSRTETIDNIEYEFDANGVATCKLYDPLLRDIAAAEELVANTNISADGKDVLVSEFWATASAINTYNSAIARAKKAVEDGLTGSQLTAAETTFATATNTFIKARKAGLITPAYQAYFEEGSILIGLGTKQTLTFCQEDENGNASNEPVIWSSGDTDVATVDKGVVTAKSIGTCTITAKTAITEREAYCVVEVAKTITGLAISSTKLLLVKGGKEGAVDIVITDKTGEAQTDFVIVCDETMVQAATDGETLTVVSGETEGKTNVILMDRVSGKSVTLEVQIGKAANAVTTTLKSTDVNLNPGKTVTLNAAGCIKDQDGNVDTKNKPINTAVIWDTNDSDVATVDQTGKVTAVALGTCTITATSVVADGDCLPLEFSVTVYPEFKSFTLTDKETNKTVSSILVVAGDEDGVDISDYVNIVWKDGKEHDEDGFEDVTYASSNAQVAEVDENGIVTGTGTGSAKITVTMKVTGKTATLSVQSGPAADIVTTKLKSTEVSLNPGKSTTLNATAGIKDPATGTAGKTKPISTEVVWTSSNENIATVDEKGKVTAVELGVDCVITATPKYATEYCEVLTFNVTVCPELKSFTLADPDTKKAVSSILVVAGDEDGVDISRYVNIVWKDGTEHPEYGFENVTYASSNEQAVTVDEDGVVTGINTGTAIVSAKITVTMTATGKTATLTVQSGPAADIVTTKLKSTEVSLNPGKSTTLNATAGIKDPATGTAGKTKPISTEVVWESSDESVATVDQKGKVTAVALGKDCVITATPKYATADCEVLTFNVAVCPELKSFTLADPDTKKAVSSILVVAGDEDGVDISRYVNIVWKDNESHYVDGFEDVTYASSNEQAVTVDENGVVNGINTGTAIVSAKITVTMTSTGKTATLTVQSGPAADIVTNKLKSTNVSLYLNKSTTLSAVAGIKDETGAVSKTKPISTEVVWESLDESIATVDEKGKVTAVGLGTDGECVIIAKPKYAAKEDCTNLEYTISVSPEFKSMNFVDPETGKAITSLLLVAGGAEEVLTDYINIVWVDGDSHPDYEDVTYTIAQKDEYAAVSEAGVLHGLATGTAKITVTMVSTGKSATITANVGEAANYIYTKQSTEVSLTPKKSTTLTATAVLRDPETEAIRKDKPISSEIEWDSSNTGVAVVDTKGKVIAVSVGKCTITAIPKIAAYGMEPVTFNITVTPELKSFSFVDPNTAKTVSAISLVMNGGQADLKEYAKIIWKDGLRYDAYESFGETFNFEEVTFTTSDETVAAVGEDGHTITAGAKGKATITATMKSTGKTAKLTVNTGAAATRVTTKIAESARSQTLIAGKTLSLNATAVIWDEAAGKASTKEKPISSAVYWTSSDPEVATVDASGKVIALFAGETTITARAAAGSADCNTIEFTITVIPQLKSFYLYDPVTGKKTTTAKAYVGDVIDVRDYIAENSIAVTGVDEEDIEDYVEIGFTTTSSTAVAELEEGFVTCKGKGKAVITVTVTCGSQKKTANLSITIQEAPAP